MDALIYFLIWGAAIFLMLRFGCGAHVMGHGRQGESNAGKKGADSAELRWVPPESDVDHFCSRECRELFEAAPQLYVGPQAAQQHRQLEHHDG
jgi:hypothetical protein